MTPGLEETFLRGTNPGYGKPGTMDLKEPFVPVLEEDPRVDPGNLLFKGLFTRNDGITGLDFGLGGITLG